MTDTTTTIAKGLTAVAAVNVLPQVAAQLPPEQISGIIQLLTTIAVSVVSLINIFKRKNK